MSTVDLDNLPTVGGLLEPLQAGHRVRVKQWSVGISDGYIWATNPYGIDVGYVEISAAGCEKILKRIENDAREHEWGHL